MTQKESGCPNLRSLGVSVITAPWSSSTTLIGYSAITESIRLIFFFIYSTWPHFAPVSVLNIWTNFNKRLSHLFCQLSLCFFPPPRWDCHHSANVSVRGTSVVKGAGAQWRDAAGHWGRGGPGQQQPLLKMESQSQDCILMTHRATFPRRKRQKVSRCDLLMTATNRPLFGVRRRWNKVKEANVMPPVEDVSVS